MKKYLPILLILAFVSSGCGKQPPQSGQPSKPAPAATTSPNSQTQAAPELADPITGGMSRVTKKPFGLFVSPGHSPISPEKFIGYHTGTDFETSPDEQTTDVPIFAACDGKLLLKKYASGYGGVAVQSCVLNNQDVTLIYGHLRLSSIIPKVGDPLISGEKIAVLGTGYSSETDGERKHLHFGIHIGSEINILGYVQAQSDLSGWLNAADYLKSYQ
jgi:murein DD-endopeptidase MepM/ murein hydrolase activator NlpD